MFLKLLHLNICQKYKNPDDTYVNTHNLSRRFGFDNKSEIQIAIKDIIYKD